MSDDPSDDAGRLEQALERIAALAARRREPMPAATAPQANVETANVESADAGAANIEVAARLDQLIARLRATLASAGA